MDTFMLSGNDKAVIFSILSDYIFVDAHYIRQGIILINLGPKPWVLILVIL